MKFKLTGGVQLFSRVSIVACSVFSSCKQILWLPQFYSLHILLEIHCLLQIHSPICLILSKHSDELPILVSGPGLRLIFVLSLVPGIVNRTFENRTQSNSIRGLSLIEFGNRTKSNTTLSESSISEQIEFNRTNRTQSNSIRLIVFD